MAPRTAHQNQGLSKGQARAKQEPNDQEIETAQGPGKPKQGTGATREPRKSATGAAQGPSIANQNKTRAQQQEPNEQQGEAKRIGRHISSYGPKPRKALGHKNLAPQADQNSEFLASNTARQGLEMCGNTRNHQQMPRARSIWLGLGRYLPRIHPTGSGMPPGCPGPQNPLGPPWGPCWGVPLQTVMSGT